MAAKRYDRRYFDHWYRSPAHRVGGRAALERKVAMVVAVTEEIIGGRLASVLDIGCGEGRWQPVLQKLRPGSRYAGVDPSGYAVERWGRRRNLRQGSFADLDALGVTGPADLVVCCDVLHYLTAPELTRALPILASYVGGVAYLETYTRGDDIEGDMNGFHRRHASWYGDRLGAVGLVPIGMHCWVTGSEAKRLAALETTVCR